MPQTLTVVDHPLVQAALARLRDKETPMARFRQDLERVGFFLGYEALRSMSSEAIEVMTPVGAAKGLRLKEPLPVFVTILRAGNGLLAGLMDLLPDAPVGHLGIYRNEKTLEPVSYYQKLPPGLPERLVVICDPMLATGHTGVAAVTKLKEKGARNFKYLSLVAAPEGIKVLQEAHPDVAIFTAAIDSHLNDHGYIVPGLGDAGDRIYGTL